MSGGKDQILRYTWEGIGIDKLHLGVKILILPRTYPRSNGT